MEPTTPVIQTIDLTHRYGEVLAVKDLNLSVYEGEIFGFLGPNGAGKTTTIRMLLDYIRPTTGSATIFGKDVRAHGIEIRREVGYLPSELTLWENMTGTRLIRWMSKIYGRDLMPEAQTLSERLQFDLGRSLKGMSTGMKRKIGLIASLAHRPKLLILDEPTIGLDPLMQEVFHEIALEAKAEGRTIFMSSHSLPEVEQICDRVGIIRDGELAAVETIERLTRVAFRWLTISYVEPVPSNNGWEDMAGVSEVSIKGDTVRLKVAGEANLDAILRHALQYTITDLAFENPSLEEIFLSYYGKRSA